MTHPTCFFPVGHQNAMASGSSFKAKRKYASADSDDEYDRGKQMRVRSPQLNRRSTFPTHQQQQQYNLPELMSDQSNSASDSEHDQPMDTDMMMEHDAAGALDNEGQPSSYSFGAGGSGGFGFGPGAEEDDEMDEMDSGMKDYPTMNVYPSLTPHPNPHHFSNHHPSSPFSAQPFSTTLAAPRSMGLLQPQVNQVPFGASDVDKARAQHGSHCKSIPKLVMSEHPDPVTGAKSMWTVCGDCGACERAA